MTKVLLFDLWGTIIENGVFPSPVRQIKRILRINSPFSEYIIKFEDVFMLQKFENLTEAFKDVCKSFNINPPEFVIDKCVGLWNKNAILAKPFPESMDVLNELKKKYQLILISNTDAFSADQVIKKFELENIFNMIVLSYEFGMLKTNPKFFDKIAKQFNLNKKDFIIIGDSLESDMKPAENASIKSILIDRRDKREYEQKILTLDEIEKFL